MSNSFWVHPVGKALGEIQRDVKKLVVDNGEVREGFLDRTGFKTIYQTSPTQTGLDLARSALQIDYQWLKENIDTLIYLTSTGERSAPGNGHLLHAELNLDPHVLVLDINDACTGFLRGLTVGESLIRSGTSRNVLIVISDTYSKLYTDSNLRVSPLFSDGASATILTREKLTIPGLTHPARQWEILSTTVISDGKHADELAISRGNAQFPLGELDMNGAGVFNFVVKHLLPSVNDALTDADLDREQIDRWYVHQGSRAVVDAVSKTLALDSDQQFVAADYGNVIGSAIPFQLLDEDVAQSREDEYLFLVAFGVGLTLVGITIKQHQVVVEAE